MYYRVALAFFLSSSLTSRAIFFFEAVVVNVLIFSIGHMPLKRPSKTPLSFPSRRFLARPLTQPAPPLPKPTIADFNICDRVQFLKYEFQHIGIRIFLRQILFLPFDFSYGLDLYHCESFSWIEVSEWVILFIGAIASASLRLSSLTRLVVVVEEILSLWDFGSP